MIFSELYSAYYNAVASIITELLSGELCSSDLRRIVEAHAFSESASRILESLTEERWQLVTADMRTPLRHPPTMPPTTLQRRWLKAISLDPRIRLFGVEPDLPDEPLFTEEDYYIYDRYGDGDPYEDEAYISHFRTILGAIHDGASVRIEMLNRRQRPLAFSCIPARLEYSAKDDKFRVIAKGAGYIRSVNLARILSCRRCDGVVSQEDVAIERHNTVVIELADERNALERCMLHFAHFEKEAEKLGEKCYRIRIHYDKSDETELLIRILSFGPRLRVVAPDAFVDLIRERLFLQKNCGL